MSRRCNRAVALDARRRALSSLAALGLAGFAPLGLAQSPPGRVAWISPTRAAEGTLFLDALRRGLRERGYVEGRNLVIETYWGDDSGAKLPELAKQIVASKPHVVVALGPTGPIMKRATSTIPVVFGYSGDPVEAGLVETLARPGGNLTGVTYLTLQLIGKRVELIKEMLPQAKRLAVIANPQHPGDKAERRVSEHAAAGVGVQLEYFEARNGEQLMAALTAVEKSRSDAVMLFPVQFVISNRERIAEWSVRNRIPAISGWSQFADGGNLMTYGPDLAASFRRLANFVERILKGVRPADLAVEQPSVVELVVNRKAAKALGLTIPKSILLRADRVIE
jgi:putative ABC transport system substrate-binding protein